MKRVPRGIPRLPASDRELFVIARRLLVHLCPILAYGIIRATRRAYRVLCRLEPQIRATPYRLAKVVHAMACHALGDLRWWREVLFADYVQAFQLVEERDGVRFRWRAIVFGDVYKMPGGREKLCPFLCALLGVNRVVCRRCDAHRYWVAKVH